MISKRAMDEFYFPAAVFLENLIFSLMTMYYICHFLKEECYCLKNIAGIEVTLKMIIIITATTANT